MYNYISHMKQKRVFDHTDSEHPEVFVTFLSFTVPNILYVYSKDPDHTVTLRRLILIIAVSICLKDT